MKQLYINSVRKQGFVSFWASTIELDFGQSHLLVRYFNLMAGFWVISILIPLFYGLEDVFLNSFVAPDYAFLFCAWKKPRPFKSLDGQDVHFPQRPSKSGFGKNTVPQKNSMCFRTLKNAIHSLMIVKIENLATGIIMDHLDKNQKIEESNTSLSREWFENGEIYFEG